MSQTEPVPLADAASSWPGGDPGGGGSELRRRIWFTLGALLVYRLGTHIPLPGIDWSFRVEPFWIVHVFPVPQVDDLLWNTRFGVFVIFDFFAGGALGQVAILALGLMPYLAAVVLMQLLAAVSPRLRALRDGLASTRKVFAQYTRYCAVVLCIFQAYTLAMGLEGIGAALNPGLMFRANTVVTLTAGSVFLMWLAEQITRRGLGGGIGLIILAGILASLTPAFIEILEVVRPGYLPAAAVWSLPVMIVALVAVVVVMERAQRRVVVQYPKRQTGAGVSVGGASHVPLRINTSGLVAPLLASVVVLMFRQCADFLYRAGGEGTTWIEMLLGWTWHLDLILYACLIVLFAFHFGTARSKAADLAAELEKHGGFIPGVRPGKDTAAYLSRVLTRLTTVAAAYLALVCLLPEILISEYAVPFYFGGTSLLIAVVVTMDTVGQIHAHLLAQRPGPRG